MDRSRGDGFRGKRSPSSRSYLRSGPVLPRFVVAVKRGSALLGWVKDDAEFIAAQIAANATTITSEGRTEQDETLGAIHAIPAREET